MIKIIAEAGTNWRTMEEAKRFIDESKRLGLFATKFQVYSEEQIKDHPQREFLESIRIDKFEMIDLLCHGDKVNQKVFFTPMFEEAVEWCEALGVDLYKIRHADRWNGKLIMKILKTGKKTFISTDIPFRSEQLISLLCIPEYPATFTRYHERLSKMERGYYNGVSDHTNNLVLLEACILNQIEYFEKHVCLTKDGLEAEWSVTFKELEAILK